jgi:diketogulonate reductase-like aldo/keto reductase
MKFLKVLIRFGLDRGLCIIPKSTTPSRIEANGAVFDFKLTADEVSAMLAMNANFRVVEIPQNINLKYSPWKVPYTE